MLTSIGRRMASIKGGLARWRVDLPQTHAAAIRHAGREAPGYARPEQDLFEPLRAAESIERPLGNDRFLARIERLTGRSLEPGKRGPKPSDAKPRPSAAHRNSMYSLPKRCISSTNAVRSMRGHN